MEMQVKNGPPTPAPVGLRRVNESRPGRDLRPVTGLRWRAGTRTGDGGDAEALVLLLFFENSSLAFRQALFAFVLIQKLQIRLGLHPSGPDFLLEVVGFARFHHQSEQVVILGL